MLAHVKPIIDQVSQRLPWWVRRYPRLVERAIALCLQDDYLLEDMQRPIFTFVVNDRIKEYGDDLAHRYVERYGYRRLAAIPVKLAVRCVVKAFIEWYRREPKAVFVMSAYQAAESARRMYPRIFDE